MSFEDYADLAGTGYQGGGGEKVAPEEEFFHSVYIAGTTRKNHINVTEEAGKFQIRGLQYNLDEVNMIITHTKEVLCNDKQEQGRPKTVCFSYKDGAPPWNGTARMADGSQRVCPNTSAERALIDFCNPCRAQIIVAGIYCKADGSPILTEENKPIFIFIRGKGMKYPNVSEYLNDCYQGEYPPLFEPVTEQSLEFEKRVVNNKRSVTRITKGEAQSNYGTKTVFNLSKGVVIPNDSVISILKMSKQTVGKFNEKFDWSKRKQAVGYGTTAAPEGVMIVDDGDQSTPQQNNESTPKAGDTGKGKTFSFEDINF